MSGKPKTNQILGQLLYALNPTTGTLLWWALCHIAQIIMHTAAHSIPIDPSLPVAQHAYIPQFHFDRIAMQCPAILLTLENIQGWFTNFQTMGQQAVQWIQMVCNQSAYLGLYLGWNWDALSQELSRLEFPNQYLLKGPDADIDPVMYTLPSTYNSSGSDLSSEFSSGSVTPDEDIVMEDTAYGNRSLILHPLFSADGKHYPDYDVFSEEPLIDNGYVDRGAGNLMPYASSLSPLESTTFHILSLPLMQLT
ncbi:hypothetical protein K443DRAFT_133731 [Laccaria amethystina LaAM-08-1]|uniref:Uncharacterized protein n=1 Tax=Laccaria amethystina LaAM-08-1 TaxID=1095629 RepID=A0A0C9XP82_9AGAR|nr:hypothetical protein K443DRAFT_133731 [Laccaria amethystina LaAM-08-1]